MLCCDGGGVSFVGHSYHVYCCAALVQKNETNYVVGWVAYETFVRLPKSIT